MSAFSEAFETCRFRSIVGPRGADLFAQVPAAVIVAAEPGWDDLHSDLVAEVVGMLRDGKSVLVIARTPADRDRLGALLGAIPPATPWGHA